MTWAFSALHKSLRKTCVFLGLALLEGMLRRAVFVIFRCWAPGDRHLGSLWQLWGAITLLGAALGGHLAPKGSPWTIFGSVPPRGLAEGNQVWRPKEGEGSVFLAVGAAHNPLLGRQQWEVGCGRWEVGYGL